ncbi:hypothetical protein ACQJBY_054998 [Aegilops geniculata]
MKILSVKYGDPYSGISEASLCLLSPQQAVIQSRVHQVLYHVRKSNCSFIRQDFRSHLSCFDTHKINNWAIALFYIASLNLWW